MSYNSYPETMQHIQKVRNLMDEIVVKLLLRANIHDLSKLEEPEKSMFDKFTPMLRSTEYMSKRYKEVIEEMGPALQHHYMSNEHHPEHWIQMESEKADQLEGFIEDYEMPEEIKKILVEYTSFLRSRMNRMSLIDIIEMLADWYAAGQRHDDGNIFKSLSVNRVRFAIDEQLFNLLKNTAIEMGWNG